MTTGGVYYRGYTTLSNTLVFEMFDTTGNQTKRLTYTIDTTTRAYTFANAYLPIVKDNINSQTATSGQVLSADGIGGASWQTPSGAGFDNYVEINTTSGTFTDDEYAKLVFNDSVIVYDNSTYKTIYKKKIETSSIIEFESIDASARQNLKLIDVNKGTKAFSSTGISMITSATFDSGSATSGKVLTANGSGGTSWETAGGSSLNKYTFTPSNSNSDRLRLVHIIKQAKHIESIIDGSTNYFAASSGSIMYLNGISCTRDSIYMTSYGITEANGASNFTPTMYVITTASTARSDIIWYGTMTITYYNDTEILS